MLERVMEDNKALVQIRSGRSPKIGTFITLDSYKAQCIDRQDNFFILQFDKPPLEIFNSIGHVPLPPYIKRPDEELDKDRYATVYEDKKLQESVAAPTAGLHFDDELLNAITKIGANVATINLSVGAGTFQPVKVDNIEDHDIHSEYLEVSPKVVDMVLATKKAGKKVFSVGTTATRALETAFMDENHKGYKGYTKLFIYPGYKFKAVDRLITNFHLPRSSLLMLVSAFVGYDNMKHIYKTAVNERYRFLSYGDAMLLKKHEV
jgi:S-adenosylmethionine:tRNA ribosyltransferase-isomerase